MEKKKKKSKVVFGICPECKIRENDSSKKRLYKCRYCGRYFCKRHLPPRLAVMRNAIEEIKDPVLKDKVYEEWRKPNGHPDWIWTRRYFQKLRKKEEEERKKFFELLDKWKKPIKKPEKRPIVPSIIKTPSIEKVKTPIKYSKGSRLKEVIEEFFWKIKLYPYEFLKYIFITLTILVLLHFFFVGKFGVLPLILRAIGIVLLGHFVVLIYRKTQHIIPYKWLILCTVVIISAHIFSTNDYSVLKVSDTIIGIPQFTDNLVQELSQSSTTEIIRKPKAAIGIGESIFRYKTSEEILDEKILELRKNSSALEKKIHDLINERRRQNGLSPLSWDERLVRIARYHSKDMAKRDYFAHESPEGEDLEIRYKKFGYFCRISVGNLIYSGAENILLTHAYNSYYYDPLTGKITEYVFNTIDDISYDTVDGWMNSEGHRQNILASFFLREGIGVYVDSDGEIYITEDFC